MYSSILHVYDLFIYYFIHILRFIFRRDENFVGKDCLIIMYRKHYFLTLLPTDYFPPAIQNSRSNLGFIAAIQRQAKSLKMGWHYYNSIRKLNQCWFLSWHVPHEMHTFHSRIPILLRFLSVYAYLSITRRQKWHENLFEWFLQRFQ